MDQSDTMLVTSLKQFIDVPNEIQTLRDIRTQQIYILACNLFESIGAEYEELKSMKIKTQRFRAMTKLTQSLNKELDSQFQLNDIMNPTVSFLRKLILTMINKIGASDLVDQNKGKRIQKMNENKQKNRHKQIMKNWVNTQWILPQLHTEKIRRYEPHHLKMTVRKDIFKRNIVNQFSNVSGNVHAIIQSALTKQKIEKKKKIQDEGITRKQQEQLGRDIYRIVKNNQDDWINVEKKQKKLRKKLIEQQREAQKKQQEKNSVFQKEVQKILVENKKQIIEDKISETNASETNNTQADTINPLQKIKLQCENKRRQLEKRLQEIMNLFNSKKADIEQKQAMKKNMEDQLLLYEDRIQAQRQMRPALKKQAEKMKLLLDSVETGQKATSQQVKQLEQQVNFLEAEANKQISSLEQQIHTTKQQGDRKMQILKDLKLKLAKIQIDYQNIVEQISDKNQIKAKVKINKSGISRTYYSKKISDMEIRWRQTQKQSAKISQQVEKLRQDIRRNMNSAERSQIEIQNIVNSSKFKGQNENNQFKGIVANCRKIFSNTIAALDKINETKHQIKQYQAKVHFLSGKDYPENIKKIKTALDELSKEIKQMQKNVR